VTTHRFSTCEQCGNSEHCETVDALTANILTAAEQFDKAERCGEYLLFAPLILGAVLFFGALMFR
jgi:hypothetical protein